MAEQDANHARVICGEEINDRRQRQLHKPIRVASVAVQHKTEKCDSKDGAWSAPKAFLPRHLSACYGA